MDADAVCQRTASSCASSGAARSPTPSTARERDVIRDGGDLEPPLPRAVTQGRHRHERLSGPGHAGDQGDDEAGNGGAVATTATAWWMQNR